MIRKKSKKEIEIMRDNGRTLARIINSVKKKVRPGVKGEELERLVESLIVEEGGKPGFKGYNGFPAALCLSLNEEVVHGVPFGKVLSKGDVLSLDLGFLRDGFYADMALTTGVGKLSRKKKSFIDVAEKALDVAIDMVQPGKTFGDVGHAVQEYVEKEGYGVVRELCGHGIGRGLHEDPEIVNYGSPGTGKRIEPGMVFCLEPMITMGDWRIERGSGGFSYVTKDGSLSAHFEHMVAVTQDGPLVLTRP